MVSSFTQNLLQWYAEYKRALPWRDHPDPYAVWVSEIMLQQTRVETVIPYFEGWLQRFPTISSLAQASLQEVLIQWEGLGYYARARNLHRAARMVMEEHQGRLPVNRQALMALPGIGQYTAGAIASFAFGKDEPILDGNIRRVLARFFDVVEPVRSGVGEARIRELLDRHLPPGKANDFSQALMDLGATICTPRKPKCDHCPVSIGCRSLALGIQNQRPVMDSKRELPHHVVTAAVIHRTDLVLITQRPPHGLLGGMWEFPGGKRRASERLEECLTREIREELGVDIELREPLGVYKHAYTHFRLTLHAFLCRLLHGEPTPLEAVDLRWVHLQDLNDFPMGKIDRQIATRLTQTYTSGRIC